MDAVVKPEFNPVARLFGRLRDQPDRHSLRDAITAFCGHCMGCTEDHMEPGFREQVRNCTAPKCPLYHVRPYQQKRA